VSEWDAPVVAAQETAGVRDVDGGPEPSGSRRRRLPVWALLPLFAVFLLVPQFVSLFIFGIDAFEGQFDDVESALATELVPDAGGAVIASAVILLLGWTGLVWRERLRTRGWVWIVPLSVIGLSLALTDVGRLSEVGPDLALALLVGTLFTGISEELMFRGIALQSLRDRVREGWAAFWTTVLFASLHLVNVLVIGSDAVVQALAALPIGFLLYLARRVSGGIAVPIVMHWLYDVSVFSQTVGPGETNSTDNGFSLLVLCVALVMLVAVLHRRVAPAKPATPHLVTQTA
jgi:membrane protease YdiL (CAAX protease family)